MIAVPKVLVLLTLTVNSVADKSNNEEVTQVTTSVHIPLVGTETFQNVFEFSEC